jgi:hypothetical protein
MSLTAFSAAAGSSVATIQISKVRARVAAGSADTRTKIAPAMLSKWHRCDRGSVIVKSTEFQTDPTTVARYAALAVPEWAARLRCSVCGGSEIDFVVSGAAR